MAAPRTVVYRNRLARWIGPMARLGLALLLLAAANTLRAEVLVLIQGLSSSGSDWRVAGMTGELERLGWADGGHLNIDGTGVFTTLSGRSNAGQRTFFTVQLPSKSPLRQQLPVLERYIAYLQKTRSHESIYLAGHSAGGILARWYMVEHPEAAIAALLTIASPHMGSDAAELGAFVTGSPLGQAMARFGVPELADWQGVLEDLRPERSGTFLHWLNRQPHPPARYIAVVRETRTESGLELERAMLGPLEAVVASSRSQDMASVISLKGRVETVRVAAGHALAAGDARVLARLLSALNRI